MYFSLHLYYLQHPAYYDSSSFLAAGFGVNTANEGGAPAAAGGLPAGVAAPGGIGGLIPGGNRPGVAPAPPPGRRRADGARLGGAIIAARGSAGPSSAGGSLLGCASACAIIGGGPSGLATSAGSSPGKIQPDGLEKQDEKRM